VLRVSWYAQILGEVETSDRAYRNVMKVIGRWSGPRSVGRVEIDRDRKAGMLRMRFDDYYRNLGLLLDCEVWKLVQKYPAETSGEYCVYSADGDIYFALCRVGGGNICRRSLGGKEDELGPCRVYMLGGETVPLMFGRKLVLNRMNGKYRYVVPEGAKERGGEG
jgi:hypothetical protein